MQKIAFLAPLVALLFTGCAGQRAYVSSGFKPIAFEVEQTARNRIVMKNNSGGALHDVVLTGWVFDGEWYEGRPWRIDYWPHGDEFSYETEWPSSFWKASIEGWCKEGRIKINWKDSHAP